MVQFSFFVCIYKAFNYYYSTSEIWGTPQRRQVLNSGKFTSGSDLACTQWSVCKAFTAVCKFNFSDWEDLQTGHRGCNEMNCIKVNLLAFSICSWGFEKQETVFGWGLLKHLLFFNIIVWNAYVSVITMWAFGVLYFSSLLPQYF